MENGAPAFDALLQTASDAYARGTRQPSPLFWAELLMGADGVAMHCPEHHFIVPAALLLAAHSLQNTPAQQVKNDLGAACARARIVPGGTCGSCGCCGAAVGTGIFAAVWLRTTPRSERDWALVNRMTAHSLQAAASVEGPRCCKRVTFLTLAAAAAFARGEMGLSMPDPAAPVCRYFPRNPECRRAGCPFFPAARGAGR